MTNVTQLRPDPADSHRSLVAAEVRGFLAKKKIPTYKVHEYLGNSRGYWQRRISGELALDIDDLAQLGGLVGRPFTVFIPADLPPMPEPETPALDYGSQDSVIEVDFTLRQRAQRA